MGTIAAFENEIMMQVEFVQNFVPPRMLPQKLQKKAIFSGAGDSFASSQLAEIFSNFRSRAHDPLDLMKNKKVFKGRLVYLVSVSGKTRSNIDLARLYGQTVAITGNRDSPLAKRCKKTILLNFASLGVQTAGSISFVASALTCMSLVSPYEIKNAPRLFQEAQRASKGIRLGAKTYILGNLHTMPIAMFCAAKLYEVMGSNACYERIEQFSHTGLFSARRGDLVIIFESKNAYNEKLVQILKKHGIAARRLEPSSKNLQEQVLFFIFISELIALYAAKKKNKKDCFFIEENELRNVSSSMIY